MKEIVGVYWQGLGLRTPQMIGFVLVKTDDSFKCYVGLASGENEEDDLRDIADWGAPVNQNVAKVLFPVQFGIV